MGTLLQRFDQEMKRGDKLSDTMWKATTEKRITVIIPEGVSVYDTTEKIIYRGDGSTYGGISNTGRVKVRRVPVNAASWTNTNSNATTDKVTWPSYGRYLRTADAFALVGQGSTGGLRPSGLTSDTTFYVIKDDTNPTSDSFKVASSRANALAKTALNITTAASGFSLAIAQLAVGGEDVLLIDPVAAAVTVYLPYPASGVSPQVTVKRAGAQANDVTIAMVDSAGAAATLTCDDLAANLTLMSGFPSRGYTFFGDPESHEYFTIGKVVSTVAVV